MAKGDKKRTYILTEDSVRVVEYLHENSVLEKSDVVDRAVKYYWKQQQSGELDDPMVRTDEDEGPDASEMEEDDDVEASFIDKLRSRQE